MRASLYRLAWRNVWRHRRRTVLLILVVAYAAFGTIFFWGFIDGTFASILTAQARFVGAPVLVTTVRYHDDPDPEHALPDLAFAAALERDARVRGMTPRLEFPALLRSAYASESVLVRGVTPEREPAVSEVPAHVTQGRMLTRTGEVVLGAGLAGRIDVRVGERAVVDTAALAGPQAAGLIVVGLVEAGVPLVDDGAALVHIDDARWLTGATTATALAVDVPRGQEDAAARSIQPLLPDGVRAYGLSEMLGPIQKDIEAHRITMIPIALIFSLVAAAAVTSTAVVSVIERTREFGMISAVGLAPARLARVVVLETIFTTLLGWVVGLAAGYALVMWLSRVNVIGGLIGAAYSRAFTSLAMTEEIYTAVRPVYILYASATVLLAAVLAALIPARRVRRLHPAEAMRIEQ